MASSNQEAVEKDYVFSRPNGHPVIISAASEQQAKEQFQVRYGYWPN